MERRTQDLPSLGFWFGGIGAIVVWVLGSVGIGAQPTEQAVARKILDATGIKGGLVVHVGCDGGKLTAALCASDSYLVHGLAADPEDVERARKHVQSLGLYGKVSVQLWKGQRLPYIDNLVTLLVAEDLGAVPAGEVMRVLAPNGVAYVKQDGTWTKTVKPRPDEIDEWTHYLHDAGGNPVSQDDVVGPPRRLQWVGSPLWSRHHDHMASMSALVSTAGRIFYVFDEGPTSSIVLPSKWSLIARDAFNGTLLWKRPIKRWHTQLWPLKSGPALLPRRLVAVGQTVYATLGFDAPLTALEASTGKTIRTYEGSRSTEEVIASDGVLFLVTRPPGEESQATRPPYRDVREIRRDVSGRWWRGGKKSVMAFRADTGQALWRKDDYVVSLTLAADKHHVFFHNGKEVVCLDGETGEPLWTSPPVPVWSASQSWFGPTLVVRDGVVLFAGGEKMIPHRGGRDTITALSAKTGEKLWSADHPPCGYQSPEDVLVAGGLVWSGATTSGGYDGVFKGLDLHTGEVRSQFAPDVKAYWFHHRCYRSKATDQYLMTSRTGIEFLDISKKHWIINHWARGGCLYGIMPCNGLIYAPCHSCACYLEAKLYGFNALAPASGKRRVPAEWAEDAELERGPAYGQVGEARAPTGDGDDWPTYRRDATRSGFTKTTVPSRLKCTWRTDLGGKLSALVIAERKLFVASVDAHTIHALDAGSGTRLWSYTAGGRVDSPPTVCRGCVLFGCADGWVYCLRAADGQLAWRFRVAPADQRLVAFEQVESVWPAHGSVLVQEEASTGSGQPVVTCVAGRSMFLDGGLRLVQLDMKTGRKLSEKTFDDRDPTTGESLQSHIMVLNMPVGLPDVLSSDGRHVFMRSQVLDLSGNRLALGPHSGNPAKQGSVQRGEEAHLFCPTGFLDGSWFHRAYWVFGRSFAQGYGGYFQAGKFAPAGRILAFDDSHVYGYARQPKYYRWTTPLEYHLFATSKTPPRADSALKDGDEGSMLRVEKSESLNPAGKPLAVEAWVKADKPNGVVVARGGPSHGYALIVRSGQPRFVVRVKEEVFSVAADQKVVGKWAHLTGVLTKDKSLEIYVDGKLSGSAKAAGFITEDPAQPMEIGSDEAGSVGDYKSPFGLTGVIDEVRVYHGTLSAAEIRKHCDNGEVAAEQATMVLCCRFDKGDATDSSGNGNNGKVERPQFVKGKVGKAVRFAGRTKSSGGLHLVKYGWTREVPLLVRAMVLADKTLFVAGPPDLVDEEQAIRHLDDAKMRTKLDEQSAALAGKRGALLWAVSSADGKTLAEQTLDAPPVWDGMAAAGGRLYVSTIAGEVLCMERE